jgi:hypothetical protein
VNSLIKNLANFEIHAVIRFLNAKILTAAEIHLQLCGVYGRSVICDKKVQQWVRKFKDGP